MNLLFLNNIHVEQILVIAPNWRFYLSRTILGVFSTGRYPKINYLPLNHKTRNKGQDFPGHRLLARSSPSENFGAPRKLGMLGIKSLKEAPPNDWPDGQTPDNKSRVEIPNNIRPSNKSRYPRLCHMGPINPDHAGLTGKI